MHSGGHEPSRRGDTGAAGAPSSRPGTPAPRSTPVPPSASVTSSTAWGSGTTSDLAAAAALSRLSLLAAGAPGPPEFLVSIYKQAGRRYHVPWRVLAAINAIETSYGRDLDTSSAGAMGWMQFMPETWRQYAVDAEGDGRPNPYDPRDAIFSAARYLHANGASRDLRAAIFAYNHAGWYVDEVIALARTITDPRSDHRAGSYSLPLDAQYMTQLGRTDDGVDLETAPDGAAVYSITPGVVTAVASDPAGFGPNYPVVLATKGPLAGRYIYYGHVAASLVRVGQPVLAGQPIAVMGHTGDAASLGHGHIEIGFSDASGSPLSHHGATAWTPWGDAMRRVLVELTVALHSRLAHTLARAKLAGFPRRLKVFLASRSR